MPGELISYEPATGAELWRGAIGDVDAEVAAARASWAEWAAKPVTFRIETLRRYANVVRAKADAFADLIARETGKPLWEAKTEVASVIAKVDISVAAYSERTGQRRMEADAGSRMALRHKPHGVLAVLGPVQFPGAFAQRPHRPRPDRGQRGGVQAVRKDPGVGRVPDRLPARGGRARRMRARC